MTTSLAVNGNNDLYLDVNGNLALVADLAAVAQDSVHAAAVVQGEYLFDVTEGLPYDACVWSNWRPAQFEAAARTTLLGVPGVKAVLAFVLTRADAVAAYTATLKTIYGVTGIRGVIPNGL